MTETTPAVCPECSGPQLPGHIKGLLTFDHDRSQCELGRAEDATLDADQRRAAGVLANFARPTTDAEWTLLLALGIDPAGLRPYTNVTVISPGVLRRHWTPKEAA